MATPDPIEQKRIAYLREAKAQATLDRLERENPTRWYHYLKFGWYTVAVIGLPLSILFVLFTLFSGG